MGFVIEEIDTEKDKERFDALGLESPFSGEKLIARIGIDNWVIDKERNIILIGLGGGAPDIPEFYALIVPEGTINFQVYEGARLKEPGSTHNENLIIQYNLIGVGIPQQLKSRAKEIDSLIKESLAAEKRVGLPNGCFGVEFIDEPVGKNPAYRRNK